MSNLTEQTIELSSDLALALSKDGYETIKDINDFTSFIQHESPKPVSVVSYDEDVVELLIDGDNARLVYVDNYWRAEMSLQSDALERALKEYEEAGGDGYNNPFETEEPLDFYEFDDEYHEEEDPSIDYDPNEEDVEARWDKIQKDRNKAINRTD